MRKILLFLLLVFFSNKSFSSENIYWSNNKSGPFTIEQAKRDFGNRSLRNIEGIWFDQGIGTVQIILDKNDYNRYKMHIIDIGSDHWTEEKFNGTWEATFYQSDPKVSEYTFFSRVWYPTSNDFYFRTQSGKASIFKGELNTITMDYDSLSETGRNMDHQMKRIWPSNLLSYNNQKKYTDSSKVNNQRNSKVKYFNGKKYEVTKETDFATTDSSQRNCQVFVSSEDKYYFCVSSDGKKTSYTKEFYKEQGFFRKGDILRYRINSEGWSSAGFLLFPKKELKIGGWTRRMQGDTIYGIFDVKTGGWHVRTDPNGEIKNITGLEDPQKGIRIAKNAFKGAKQIKSDLDQLLQANTNTYKPNNNYKTKKIKKIKSKKNDLKDYWWVVVLVAVGAFFVYMHTTKDLPKAKKISKKIIKKPGPIRKFFNGDVDLTTSFWVVYFGAGVIIGIIFFALEKNDEDMAGLFSLFILIPYTIFAMIGTWRSATKYKIEKQKKKEGTGWGTAAQVYIVLSIIRAVVEVVKEFN